MHSTTGPVIGYILKGYPRISETFISNEILLLEKLGFSMRLFPMRHPREDFCHPSVKEIKARVDYLPTELLLHFSRLWSANCFLAVKHPDRYRHSLLHAREGRSKTNALATLKHLLQGGYLANHFLLKGDINHLHGHFAHSPTSVTLFASLLSGLPFSFTAHAKDIYTSAPEKLSRKIDLARFVVTCTEHNSQYLRKISASSDTPIHCIYHGIDLSLFNGGGGKISTQQPYKLLSVARMTAKKGLATIYKALALLQENGIDFQHTLIGEGELRHDIEKRINALGLKEKCCLLGTQTHDEVLRQFRDSDLFVLGCEIAENGDRDGIPNVLVESLAMGVPAVSSSVSAIPEILLNNRTGITVPPSHPGQLEQAMRALLTQPELRTRLIQNGKQHVRENFDNKIWIHKLAELFRTYCNSEKESI